MAANPFLGMHATSMTLDTRALTKGLAKANAVLGLVPPKIGTAKWRRKQRRGKA